MLLCVSDSSGILFERNEQKDIANSTTLVYIDVRHEQDVDQGHAKKRELRFAILLKKVPS